MCVVPQAHESLYETSLTSRFSTRRFVINEEFIATLDYLVAASLWASITDARDQAQYYLHSINYYKHLDG